MTTTTTPQVLEELAGRAEAADGPDRELDWAVHEAIGSPWRPISGVESGQQNYALSYTALLDDAMTLASGRRIILNVAEDGITTAIVAGTQGIGNTPALALTAASLRSRAAEARHGQEGGRDG